MIRNHKAGDHEAIAEIFPRAIHEIASKVYTEEQCLAWSDTKPNPTHWKKRCEMKDPFVFVRENKVVGFLELDSDGHIDCMYVHPDETRKGIASQLIDHAIAVCSKSGIGKIYVEASICAKPVFEKKRFKTTEIREVEIEGIKLVNFKMERQINKVEPIATGERR